MEGDSATRSAKSPIDGVTTGSVTQLLDLLQVVDRSFPTGAFVHSQGLEWLAKQPSFDLERSLRLRIQQQLARFELIFLLHAHEGTLTTRVTLDERLHAMLLAREARDASMRVGRQLLNAAEDLYGGPALVEAKGGLPYAHQPIVFGIVAQTIGLDARGAATVYAFQAVRGQISAAQRLTRLGQVEAQRLLHRLKPAIEEAADSALNQPLASAAPFMPLLDVASMAHERMAVRLFVS
jgi:urease accessory protein